MPRQAHSVPQDSHVEPLVHRLLKDQPTSLIPLDTPIKTQIKRTLPSHLDEFAAISWVRDCTSRGEWIDPKPKSPLLVADRPFPAGAPSRNTRANLAFKSRRYLRWLQEELVNPVNGNQYDGDLEAV